MSVYSFLPLGCSYTLPESFDFAEYIEIERELWAFFPETRGLRANFCQLGLTAQIYVESGHTGELRPGETYFLMPCPDGAMKPLRMKPVRRLTLAEFRMAHITAMRLADKLAEADEVMEDVHLDILGPEILDEG
ncbi:MAG: hypothetical protein LAQ30_04325 [Acidobacteriia bacterium]|nr:hypothetical protein [Terriglobia bacterium]